MGQLESFWVNLDQFGSTWVYLGLLGSTLVYFGLLWSTLVYSGLLGSGVVWYGLVIAQFRTVKLYAGKTDGRIYLRPLLCLEHLAVLTNKYNTPVGNSVNMFLLHQFWYSSCKPPSKSIYCFSLPFLTFTFPLFNSQFVHHNERWVSFKQLII